MRLRFSEAGIARQLEADLPRAVLQRLVMGRTVDRSTQPMPLAPMPPSLGPVSAVMFWIDAHDALRPWDRGGALPVPGEEDPVRLARALNRWSRTGPPNQAAAPAVVATDPQRSVARWVDAPRSGGGGTLVLPRSAFSGGAEQALREALARSWGSGPVIDEWTGQTDTALVVVASAEPPGICAARLASMASDPAMEGRLLAGWCLSGEIRSDAAPSLLSSGGLAGLGLATSTVVDMRRAASALGEFSTALSSPMHADGRVEGLPGPFLWFF
jgi:hypothetical protein